MKGVFLETLSEEEYNSLNLEVHTKVEEGKALSKKETYFFCNNLKNDYILQYQFCHNEFYYRFFLDKDYGQNSLYKWHAIHRDFYNSLVLEWKQIISNERQTDKLLKINAEETRKELKAFKKEYRILAPNFNWANYQNEIFKIHAWSKFRYLAIKRTLDLFYSNEEFKFIFNGEEVYLNYKSLTHIATRHFGKNLKPFESDKDFFSKIFLYDNLHVIFQDIFKRIDEANILNHGYLKELSIKYHGDLYKMYFEKHVKQQKGVPDKTIIVIVTFFPLSDVGMLNTLNENFNEEIIIEGLSVFVSKNAPL